MHRACRTRLALGFEARVPMPPSSAFYLLSKLLLIAFAPPQTSAPVPFDATEDPATHSPPSVLNTAGLEEVSVRWFWLSRPVPVCWLTPPKKHGSPPPFRAPPLSALVRDGRRCGWRIQHLFACALLACSGRTSRWLWSPLPWMSD
jgi:hypothetical protein